MSTSPTARSGLAPRSHASTALQVPHNNATLLQSVNIEQTASLCVRQGKVRYPDALLNPLSNQRAFSLNLSFPSICQALATICVSRSTPATTEAGSPWTVPPSTAKEKSQAAGTPQQSINNNFPTTVFPPFSALQTRRARATAADTGHPVSVPHKALDKQQTDTRRTCLTILL
jgi:hypothetical protein